MHAPLPRASQLERQPLALAFDAERDGWSNSAWHEKMDGIGAYVLLLETEGGAVCGGYNPKGTLGYGEWRDAISAFLFTWPDGKTARAALKMIKAGGSGMAIIDEQGKGPQWGPEGLKARARTRLRDVHAH